MTPAVWLGGALAISVALFAGGVVGLFNAAQKAKHDAGLATGRGETAVATLETVKEAVAVERNAEETTPLVTIPAELIALCKRSASCIERKTLK